MFKFLIAILFNIIVSVALADQSRSCSLENEIPCKNLDVVERVMLDRVWSQIKEFEDEWFGLYFKFLPQVANQRGVEFFYDQPFEVCKNNGVAVGQAVASLKLIFSVQTPSEQKYQVLHSACGNEVFFVESWVIRGRGLPPLDWKKILIDRQRQFSLSKNETYKEVEFSLPEAQFNPTEKSFFKFETTKVPFLAKSVYQRNIEKIDEVNSKKEDYISSELALFGEKILTSKRDFINKQAQFIFLTPSLFFRPRSRRFSTSECFSSVVSYRFNKDHREIISSGSNKQLGLSQIEFNKCLDQEIFRYLSSANELLQNYYDFSRPVFDVGRSLNKSAVLKNELLQLISFIRSGVTTRAEGLVRQILINVNEDVITDKRVE